MGALSCYQLLTASDASVGEFCDILMGALYFLPRIPIVMRLSGGYLYEFEMLDWNGFSNKWSCRWSED